MLNTIKQVASDLKQGRYLESYITIGLALVIVILDVFDLAKPNWLSGATLATLALLAHGQIEERRLAERILREKQKVANATLLTKYPETFEEDLERAGELWIVGITLGRTINTYFSLIKDKLERGCKVKILLVKPNSDAIRMAVRRDCRPRDEEFYNYAVKSTLDQLSNLANEITNKKDFNNLEVRTSEMFFSFGYYAIAPSSPEGVLYLEQYGFRTEEGDIPILVIHSYDGEWYQFFRKQLFTLWNSSDKYELISTLPTENK